MHKLHKSWLDPRSGEKKFLASIIGYTLSKNLDRKNFEVVNESYIDWSDPFSERPDVVIYNLNQHHQTISVLEIADSGELEDIICSICINARIYQIPESFIYDLDKDCWYRIASGKIENTSYSSLFNIDFRELLDASKSKLLASA
jgi:hypothetical protein